ncbi:MAG: cell division protein FtsA [Candidatus Vogelbacteria bacterium]|nr:cell division protein FtsA [Candidatus Vogelbacteria bacterium]
MRSKIITGIDIGSSLIRIIVSELIKGESDPRVLCMTSKRSRGLRHGYIVDMEEAKETVTEAIKDAERMSGKKISAAFLAIGGISLESTVSEGGIAVSKADQEVGDLDVKRVIEASVTNLKKQSNRQIIQNIPLQFKLDGKKILGRPNGMKGEILEVKTLFITALEQHLNDLINIVEGAGIIIENIIPAPIAASYAVLSKIQKTAGCILTDIGAETVSIAVFEEGIPTSLKVFSIGSTDITNDIALCLKIPIEEAEEIKMGKENKGYSKKKLEDIIEARLSDIFDLIEAHLKKIGKNSLLPAGIILIGGGANQYQVEPFARQYLNLPARIAPLSILSTIPINQSNEARVVKKNIDSSWAVAYGLSTLGESKDLDEFSGSRLVKQTKSNLVKWLRQFLP